MLSGNVIEFETSRVFFEETEVDTSGGLPAVPVMPQTLLLMEFCAHERSTDLDELAQIVLSDPGATLQIMREAGRQCAFGDERPRRIEDYISALGAKACLEAASQMTVSRSMNKANITRTWSHSIEIAKICSLLADGNMIPGEAYLIGLLHEIGYLPALLDWKTDPALLTDPALAGLKVAHEWCLPRCTADYFAELAQLTATHRWSLLVRRAHEKLSHPAAAGHVIDQEEFKVAAFSCR